VQLVACDIHPLNNRRILQLLRNDLSLSDEAVQVWEHKWVAAGYRGLEGQVARHAGKYLFGDNVTMADLCLVPQVENGNRAGMTLPIFLRCTAPTTPPANCRPSRLRTRATNPTFGADPPVPCRCIEALISSIA
jgi:glutathione S-transferase